VCFVREKKEEKKLLRHISNVFSNAANPKLRIELRPTINILKKRKKDRGKA
jgi:hypothetical protein